jgi:hypothetical protein
MDSDDLLPSGPLPESLHSAFHEGPFPSCSDCDRSFLGGDELHVVERVFRGGEPIFEYALCFDCALRLLSEYSEESKEALERYFTETTAPDDAPEGACDRCGRPGTADDDERCVAGAAIGGTQLGKTTIVCGPCAEGADAVVSKKTRESFDAFMRRVAPTLPADVDLPAGVLVF